MIVHRPPTCHAFTPTKVAFVSGLSDPTTCALTPQQREFFDGLDVPESWKVRTNFPYVGACSRARPAPPLWIASLQNFRQFLQASRPRYRDAARRHWRALASSTDRLVLITLSCGFEIIRHCLDEADVVRPMHVVALGPVGWHSVPVSCTLVQGSSDLLSRLFFRRCDVMLPGVGHMDYLADRRVLDLTNELLCGSTLNSPAPGCTFPSGA